MPFLAQQSDVMDAVKRMRSKAERTGALKSTPQQTVQTRRSSTGKHVIVIEQANPEVLYVPSYNPVAVYVRPSIHTRRFTIRRGAVTPRPRRSHGALASPWVLAWGGGWGWNTGWGHNDINVTIFNNFNRKREHQPRREHQRQPKRHLAAQRRASRRRALSRSCNREQVRRHCTRRFAGEPPGGRTTAGVAAGRQCTQRSGAVGTAGTHRRSRRSWRASAALAATSVTVEGLAVATSVIGLVPAVAISAAAI
jgi:hypothetical protein